MENLLSTPTFNPTTTCGSDLLPLRAKVPWKLMLRAALCCRGCCRLRGPLPLLQPHLCLSQRFINFS